MTTVLSAEDQVDDADDVLGGEYKDKEDELAGFDINREVEEDLLGGETDESAENDFYSDTDEE